MYGDVSREPEPSCEGRFRTADVWLLFPTAESAHWFYLNTTIWLAYTQSIFLSLFPAGSQLSPFLSLCLSVGFCTDSILNVTICLHDSHYFSLSLSCIISPGFSFLFYLYFPRISLLSVSALLFLFPPHASTTTVTPQLLSHRQICTTHAQLTHTAKCMCAEREREELGGCCFAQELPKPWVCFML